MNEGSPSNEYIFLHTLRTMLADATAGASPDISGPTTHVLMASIALLAEREAALSHAPTHMADTSPHTPPGIRERRGPNRKNMAHVSLLRGVSHSTLEKLLSHCTFRDLPVNELLLTVGHSNQNIYIVMSGSVRVHLDDLAGPPYVILTTGECVGEISILGATKVTAHVICHEQARLMVIDQDLLWALIDDSPEFARNLLYTLSRRVGRDNLFLRGSLRRQRESEINASVDALTGLANRRKLDEFFTAHIDACSAKGEPLSLLMMDIDHFKRFNDTHGHLMGDAVLCAVASILAECTTHGLAARYGGEEFALVLPSYDTAHAFRLATAIQLKIREVQLQSASGEPIPPITLSAGIAQMQAGDTPQSLIHAADNALYSAKHNGRDCVMLHNAESPGR